MKIIHMNSLKNVKLYTGKIKSRKIGIRTVQGQRRNEIEKESDSEILLFDRDGFPNLWEM